MVVMSSVNIILHITHKCKNNPLFLEDYIYTSTSYFHLMYLAIISSYVICTSLQVAPAAIILSLMTLYPIILAACSGNAYTKM